MRRWLATGVLLVAATAGAQEGFPLDGTWRGERPGEGGAPVTIVMVIQWDGQKLTGVINPGPRALQISAAKLIPDGWRVSIAARTKAGQPVSFDGALGELGAYNRSITGTWTEGGHTYRVRMVRE
jgi:hypothetical protein